MNSGIKQPDKLDGILANEQELIPSSGFLMHVMNKVQDEAAAPPPIPFPWKRAMPGMVLVAGVLGWGAYEIARYASSANPIALPAVHFSLSAISLSANGPVQQAGWVVVAFAMSAGGWLLSRRLAGRSGLL